MFRFITEPELRWTTLHPDHWTINEVRSWIEFVADKNKMPTQDKELLTDHFCDVSGTQLVGMSLDDFLSYSSQHGRLLFDVFNTMCKNTVDITTPRSPNTSIPSASSMPNVTDTPTSTGPKNHGVSEEKHQGKN